MSNKIEYRALFALVNRRGRETFFHAVGNSDVENDRKVQRDTIFRIYSMTKPITSVALMMLYERGKFQLDDPVAKYVPSWKDLRVYESGEGDKIQTRPSKSPMTIKHLLTHTAGLTYGFMNNHPINSLYRRRGCGRWREFLHTRRYDGTSVRNSALVRSGNIVAL